MQIPLMIPISISTTHPAIPGHFPGMPVVPAALLLDEITYRLAQATDLDINAAKQIRFIAPLEPGQQLDVRYQQKNPAEYRFIGTEKGSPVVKGVLNYTVTEPKYVPPASPGKSAETVDSCDIQTSREVTDLYQHLPHSGRMCLLQQVLTCDTQGITCLANPDHLQPLNRGGQLPSWAALEYAAQALAFHGLLSLRERSQQSPKAFGKAMIIGVREMVCYRPQINELQPCQIEVTLQAQQPQAASCTFTLKQDQLLVSSGQFNILYETTT
ncbi:hypothetical protein KOI40_01575 [Aestuariicella sp. G3-2]|uniref:hypothetical protein n=1 Tax=Pseudomaricurvus albidus TaxID=2842452 RepID=UPI001C0B4409|nr:hypothetical protein [Aestuariicella albida]MBU3068485.1 hypothetical protein [Aestuariicella albida]